jgi:hypothetical protein
MMLMKSIQKKFGNAEKIVASTILMRPLCPALLAPQNYGLVPPGFNVHVMSHMSPEKMNKTPLAKQLLTDISKTLQMVANTLVANDSVAQQRYPNILEFESTHEAQIIAFVIELTVRD